MQQINESGTNDMLLKGQSSVQNLSNLPMIIKQGDEGPSRMQNFTRDNSRENSVGPTQQTVL